jgi:predicted transcriptional regulator
VEKHYSILELLFPQARAEILRLLFKPPQKDHYVRELTQMSGLTLCTIQDELRKLGALCLMTSRSDGYHRFYRANRDHSLFHALVQMVETSERSSRIKHSLAHRKRKIQKHMIKKQRPLSPDRPMNWNVFSKSGKT